MAEAPAAAPPAPGAADAVIRLRPWRPDAPYAARLRAASRDNVYRVYLDERPDHVQSTAFFLDAADLLFEKGLPELGVRVLSNLAEMDLENRHILRILGYRLLQAGRHELAIPVFRKVLALSPEEPQSYRDLGLAHAAAREFQQAVDLLREVVVKPWHGRFPEVELIALAELNAIAANAGQPLDLSRIDPRLLRNLPLDVRVVLTWDADNTDIDLWVTDPNGEKAYYGHRLTYQGGRMSMDFTGGYGPEEFSLRIAKPGIYKVQANFYGHRQQTVAGATTLQAKFITGFGTPGQKERIVTLRLSGANEVIDVGEMEIRPLN
jgi:Ca-activated chloride channel family protein